VILTYNTIDMLDFERGGTGLVTVVAQNIATGEVLMVAHANREAIEHTLRDGLLTLYSRSRQCRWLKGETSGNVLRVIELHADCDNDAVLALVIPAGAACHTGARTCFGGSPTLAMVADTIADRAAAPAHDSYTQRLLGNENLRLKKLGEEAVELALACSASGPGSGKVADEAADLLYHTLVACHAAGVTLQDIAAVLEQRSERASSSEKDAV
jgi:phosphoribosyl-ATP pyrophosphohydrolase/phosphoribosyl-AMP cyclohydrolase